MIMIGYCLKTNLQVGISAGSGMELMPTLARTIPRRVALTIARVSDLVFSGVCRNSKEIHTVNQ